jgi:3-hydroxyisobutyrate dehydrogenase
MPTFVRYSKGPRPPRQPVSLRCCGHPQHSAPETISWASEEAAKYGVRVVEACPTGGYFAAAEGRTTFLLGGDPEDIATLGPILSACGETLVRAGPLGNANLLKLCLNLQTYVAHLGVAEAVRLAKELEAADLGNP